VCTANLTANKLIELAHLRVALQRRPKMREATWWDKLASQTTQILTLPQISI
jgi:hypothetical protein